MAQRPGNRVYVKLSGPVSSLAPLTVDSTQCVAKEDSTSYTLVGEIVPSLKVASFYSVADQPFVILPPLSNSSSSVQRAYLSPKCLQKAPLQKQATPKTKILVGSTLSRIVLPSFWFDLMIPTLFKEVTHHTKYLPNNSYIFAALDATLDDGKIVLVPPDDLRRATVVTPKLEQEVIEANMHSLRVYRFMTFISTIATVLEFAAYASRSWWDRRKHF